MSLDINEVISNSIIGLVGLVTSYIGGRISRFISKVNKAEKDLNAVFPKIRKLEAALGLKGGCDGDASRDRIEDRIETANGILHQQGSRTQCVGSSSEDKAGV